jgi:hypothetical protein
MQTEANEGSAMQHARVAVGVGLTGVLAAALAAGCVALVDAAVETGRGLWQRRDDLAFDDLVLTGALGALALAAGWLCAGLTVCAVGEAVPGADRLVRRISRRMTPAVCRRVVAACCGAATVAGPAVAVPAAGLESGQPDRRPAGCLARVCGPPLGVLPLPDRPMPGVLLPDRSARRSLPPTVRVRPGDTLWSITAERLPRAAPDADIAAAWPRWHHTNRARIGPDPHLIHPGTRLRPPPRLH